MIGERELRGWLPLVFFSYFNAQQDTAQCEEADDKEKDKSSAILHIAGVLVLRNLGANNIDMIGQGHDALEEEVGRLGQPSQGSWSRNAKAAVNMIGAVSPATRAIPMIEEVRMPGKA